MEGLAVGRRSARKHRAWRPAVGPRAGGLEIRSQRIPPIPGMSLESFHGDPRLTLPAAILIGMCNISVSAMCAQGTGPFMLTPALLVMILGASPPPTGGPWPGAMVARSTPPSPDRIEGFQATIAKRRKRRVDLHRFAEM